MIAPKATGSRITSHLKFDLKNFLNRELKKEFEFKSEFTEHTNSDPRLLCHSVSFQHRSGVSS